MPFTWQWWWWRRCRTGGSFLYRTRELTGGMCVELPGGDLELGSIEEQESSIFVLFLISFGIFAKFRSLCCRHSSAAAAAVIVLSAINSSLVG